MSTAQTDDSTTRKPLRLWPGVIAAVLLLLFMFAVPMVIPDTFLLGMIGGLASGVAILVWWVLFSRAPWSERVGTIVVMIVALFATSRIVHPSIANAGMGMLLPIFGFPVLSFGLVAGTVASRRAHPARLPVRSRLTCRRDRR